ncbi:MAG: glycosyltransferase family 9 protein [Sediminibacterium sp.]|nr:glycosyltransferase family 9 protein [Sediminibacterium sp.]
MKNFLIIQTAFLGDVILITSVIESIKNKLPAARIDVLVRSPHEHILTNHPHIQSIIVWDKKKNKYLNLFKVIFKIRQKKYDVLINVQRFFSTGFISLFSNSKIRIGFKQNPLSLFFTHSVNHQQYNKKQLVHEIERNQQLLLKLGNFELQKPKLYPAKSDYDKVFEYRGTQPYICIAPCSVWFTKEFPLNKWVELINLLKIKGWKIFIIGSPQDFSFAENIIAEVKYEKVLNLCGKISLLQVAAMMEQATMNYVNDSAPLHIASSMNAAVKAIFLSTAAQFGFFPLSDDATIVSLQLDCQPCTDHGRKKCPLKHFDCAQKINVSELLF